MTRYWRFLILTISLKPYFKIYSVTVLGQNWGIEVDFLANFVNYFSHPSHTYSVRSDIATLPSFVTLDIMTDRNKGFLSPCSSRRAILLGITKSAQQFFCRRGSKEKILTPSISSSPWDFLMRFEEFVLLARVISRLIGCVWDRECALRSKAAINHRRPGLYRSSCQNNIMIDRLYLWQIHLYLSQIQSVNHYVNITEWSTDHSRVTEFLVLEVWRNCRLISFWPVRLLLLGTDVVTMRIPGVLQRFSFTYLVIALIHYPFARHAAKQVRLLQTTTRR